MKFLEKVLTEILDKNSDLSEFIFVLPGKRPVVFIKEILKKTQYEGFLPQFFTIEDLFLSVSGQLKIEGITLWLHSYELYKSFENEDFSEFLKWFPTIAKDWDDILKFADDEKQVLQWLLDEERIKNWGEKLTDENLRKKNLNFWRKMNVFLPKLQQHFEEKNWATSGMIHQFVKKQASNFAETTQKKFVFLGFNAFTPAEEKLVRALLQWNKAEIFFQADQYYLEDEKQESGAFLREYLKWKEFNDFRTFHFIENQFSQKKEIKVFEVPGNITQTKLLPEILSTLSETTDNHTETAIVLLDENLLPASLDSLKNVENLNITMGFPLKNLSFSNAVKKLFYLQKQLHKSSSSYYYKDVLSVVEEIPNDEKDEMIIKSFTEKIEEHNIVYISKKHLQEMLGSLSYFPLFLKAETENFIDEFINFCRELKFRDLDDILYENISHFEKSFITIKNQLSSFSFPVNMDTLEVLINQIVNTECIDFQGEPLRGLQVMGLLETRLLDFENIIMLSVNEGKLPLGNSQNTYLPFDLRKQFQMHTFLENDSIYAYHFYRLLQNSQKIFLIYNALSSGISTGEKSRFITQLELESPHKIDFLIVENSTEPVKIELMSVNKTPLVLEKLEEWKNRVAASHLVSYLYNPIQFYLEKVLHTKETNEIEEELSQRNYGTLVHYSLDFLYQKVIGKILKDKDLEDLIRLIPEALDVAINNLKHQPEFYNSGMNFIHKEIAKKVIESILKHDLNLVKKGNSLEILALELKVEDIPFYLDEEKSDAVKLVGYIDRIDRLNGEIRVIDYKTGKTDGLKFKITDEEKAETIFFDKKHKQALQLCIYLHCMEYLDFYNNKKISAGIWSFAEVNKGVQLLEIENNTEIPVENSIRNLILEILNPELDFTENEKLEY